MYKTYKSILRENIDTTFEYSRYALLENIGSGGFSDVYRGYDYEVGRVVAIKLILDSSSQYSEDSQEYTEDTLISVIFQEAFIMNGLNHPNIIRMFEFIPDPVNPVIVLEIAEGGDLYKKLKEENHFSEWNSINIMKQILSAVDYLHSKNIVHRDLKPENMLYKTQRSDSIIMLTDFGLSCRQDLNVMMTPCGTINYSAPELLMNNYLSELESDDGEETMVQYDQKVDVWSIGVLLYYMLCGYLPFQLPDSSSSSNEASSDNEIKLEKVIISGNYEFHEEYWSRSTAEAKDLIFKMLQVDASLRISINDALNHPWMHMDKLDLPNTWSCSESESGTELNQIDKILKQMSDLEMNKLDSEIYDE